MALFDLLFLGLFVPLHYNLNMRRSTWPTGFICSKKERLRKDMMFAKKESRFVVFCFITRVKFNDHTKAVMINFSTILN